MKFGVPQKRNKLRGNLRGKKVQTVRCELKLPRKKKDRISRCYPRIPRQNENYCKNSEKKIAI